MNEKRCSVCGWPLVERVEDGCVEGNCSMRPRPSTQMRNEAQAEAASLRQALINIRKDVHFAQRTQHHDDTWETLCEDIKRQIDEVTPNHTPGAELLKQYHHAVGLVRDLQDKMLPANEYVARLEEAADLAIRGFRRWKRNQRRRGDRYEGEHGLTDLGQGISDLDELMRPSSPTHRAGGAGGTGETTE